MVPFFICRACAVRVPEVRQHALRVEQRSKATLARRASGMDAMSQSPAAETTINQASLPHCDLVNKKF